MTSVHYIAMPEMVMRIAEVRDHLTHHPVLSTLNEKQYQHNLNQFGSDTQSSQTLP
jgi:hypothetical protein